MPCLSRESVEHARSIVEGIRDQQPELRLSKQKHKRVQAIELVRQQREERSQPLLFGARPFLLCGLPLKRRPAGTLVHERRNGNFFLQVCGHPQFGLPFGQDRLVPIWVATQAVRMRGREFRFSSGAEILSEFGLPPDGPHYRRLFEGFQRIFASTILFGTEHHVERAKVWDCGRFTFFDRLRLWTANEGGISGDVPEENVVILSEAFWKEVHEHPIPVERDVVRALAHAPGPLDFYMWLVWRSYGRAGTQRIPLFGNAGLVHQLGSSEYSRPRDFVRTVRRWRDTVCQLWPDCPAELVSGGTVLLIRPARVIHKAV